MIPVRHAPETTPIEGLHEEPPRPREDNLAWLRRAGAPRSGILLLGGAGLVDFRVRVAQSHVRQDMTPSCWSEAGILGEDGMVTTVPLDLGGGVASVPGNNGVHVRPLARYESRRRYPNIAVFDLPVEKEKIAEAIQAIRNQRSILDLPTALLRWLGFVWGAANPANPLLDQHGVPSASFVAAAYASAGIDLAPGLGTMASCPEIIWQSVRFWGNWYARAKADGQGEAARKPSAVYAIRQPAAAIRWPGKRRSQAPAQPEQPPIVRRVA